jgi:hypothetical protein
MLLMGAENAPTATDADRRNTVKYTALHHTKTMRPSC